MITVTCDMCGEKLSSFNEVTLELGYEGLSTLSGCSFEPKHKQLCVTCATRLLLWIDNQLEKGDDIDV